MCIRDRVDAARRPERQFVIQRARHDQKVNAPVSYTHLDVYKRQGELERDGGTAQTLGRISVDVTVGGIELNAQGLKTCLLYTSRCV